MLLQMSLWSRVRALPPLSNKLNFPASEADLPKVMSASRPCVWNKAASSELICQIKIPHTDHILWTIRFLTSYTILESFVQTAFKSCGCFAPLVFEKPCSLRILPINCIMLKNNPITKDTAGHKNKSDFSKIEISLKLKKLIGGGA